MIRYAMGRSRSVEHLLVVLLVVDPPERIIGAVLPHRRRRQRRLGGSGVARASPPVDHVARRSVGRRDLVPELVHSVRRFLLLLLLVTMLACRGGGRLIELGVVLDVAAAAFSQRRRGRGREAAAAAARRASRAGRGSGHGRRRGRRRRRLRLLARRLLLPGARPPVVLDLVVGAAGEAPGDARPPAAVLRVELEDEALLVGGDAAAAEARVEVVDPPETAALAGAPQTCSTPTRMHREEAGGGEEANG